MNHAGTHAIVPLGPTALTPDTHASAAANVPDTLEALVARDYARIRRLAARFGIPRDELDDASQEVFAKAWMHRAEFHGGAALSTWLTRIALNHFATRIKRDARRWWRRSDELGDGMASRSNPRRDAQSMEKRDIAADCVRKLPRLQREAFVLRYLEEMTYAEAAEVLGVPEGTIRARTFEARKRLREMLKEFDL